MSDLAVPGDNIIEGLEDYDPAADAVMPIIQIDHRDAKFKNNLTNEEFTELSGVALGVVKQRVLWDSEISDSKQLPWCRSYDFHIGHPRLEVFPWAASGFATQEETLPCQDCKLKEWDSHPTRNIPWCQEQHTYVFMQAINGGGYNPVLLSIQRSGLKDSKNYMTSFANARQPMFTVGTKLTLEVHRKGANPYAVVKFHRLGETDDSLYEYFVKTLRGIRKILQTPSGMDESTEPEPSSPEPPPAPAPAAPPPTAPSSGIPVSGPGTTNVADDDLPF